MITLSSSRKVLIPVGTLLGAAGLMMTSGIPWTSASEGTAGIRLSADAGHGAVLTITHMVPGQQVTRKVTIRNSGAVASRISFQETGERATFADGELALLIRQDGRQVYAGPFGGMSDFAQDMGFLEPGGSSTFTFTVSLPDDAPYANQGSAATASYSWVTAPGSEASGAWG